MRTSTFLCSVFNEDVFEQLDALRVNNTRAYREMKMCLSN